MKTRRFVLTLAMAVALVSNSIMPAMAHTPIADFDACPDALTTPYAPLPTFIQTTVGSPVTAWPAIGSYNFCAHMDTILCSLKPVAGMMPEVAIYANLLRCVDADINGPVNPAPEGEQLPITPNGIPDGQFELAILAAVLNTPAHPLHAAALAAVQGNFVWFKDAIQAALQAEGFLTLLPMVAPNLVGGLGIVLAGFAAMGDPATNAALDMLLGLLADIGLQPPPGGVGAVTTSVPQLGPAGDTDGDGFSNRAEYNFFVGTQGYTPAQYVAAALDAAQTPPTVEASVIIRGGGRKQPIGTDVSLRTVVAGGVVVSYEWLKNGVVLADEEGPVLDIPNAQVEDSGVYTVVVGMELPVKDAKVVIGYVSANFVLDIGPYTLPVGSALGLSMLISACALAGIMVLRRRK